MGRDQVDLFEVKGVGEGVGKKERTTLGGYPKVQGIGWKRREDDGELGGLIRRD